MLQQRASYFVAVARSEAGIEGAGARGQEPGYRLAAAGREAAEGERLDLLEQIYDPVSRRRRGLVQPGWRCLEVGGGRGSMAAWLAEKVGPAGQVVATDIDLGYLRQLDLPNLEVVEHNILEDPLEPLGPGSFDLVCSRLMLFHLVDRQELAIRQMARCLRPGGWLVDEDADWGMAAPVDPSHPLYAGYHDAWSEIFPSEPGLTCCQAQFVNNHLSQLYKRTDLILNLGSVEAQNIALFGADPSTRTPGGLWPSDHAGVAAQLVVETNADDSN